MTKTELVSRGFEKMGARVKFSGGLRWRQDTSLTVDVQRDKEGEFFDIRMSPGVDLRVVDVQPRDRHLVLMAVMGTPGKAIKDKFLCGHDERHWFAAAVPEDGGGINGVKAAKNKLRPADVKDEHIRQGEWFFVPAPEFVPGEIHKNEPLSRGPGSKPHICQELCRSGGRTVWMWRSIVMNDAEYQNVLASNPKEASLYRSMIQDAAVYVRGTVRHSDHKTIRLDGWHRVYMNTERFARAARNVLFLD